MNSSKVLWRVKGETVSDVECAVASPRSKYYNLTVSRADDTMLNETYPDLQSAIVRADDLRTRLAKHGWHLSAPARA
jgi:hypothetical protein